MSVHSVLLYPEPRLAQPCVDVAEVNSNITNLIDDMFDTMYAAQGRGLAAPQIGVMQRIFVMDAGWKSGTPTPLAFINPALTSSATDMARCEEACLSMPGISAEVDRPARIELVWTSQDATSKSGGFDGFEAVCIQHEMDHLNGLIILDHLDAAARAEAEARYFAERTAAQGAAS